MSRAELLRLALAGAVCALALAVGAPARAADSAEHSPEERARPAARALAGAGRGVLDLDGAHPATRLTLAGSIGAAIGARAFLGADLALDLGRTDHGVFLPRVATGATGELRLGRFALGAGPHVGLHGFVRKSNLDAGPDGVTPSWAVLRPFAGAHATVAIDVVRIADRGWLTLAARGDLDWGVRGRSAVLLAGISID